MVVLHISFAWGTVYGIKRPKGIRAGTLVNSAAGERQAGERQEIGLAASPMERVAWL